MTILDPNFWLAELIIDKIVDLFIEYIKDYSKKEETRKSVEQSAERAIHELQELNINDGLEENQIKLIKKEVQGIINVIDVQMLVNASLNAEKLTDQILSDYGVPLSIKEASLEHNYKITLNMAANIICRIAPKLDGWNFIAWKRRFDDSDKLIQNTEKIEQNTEKILETVSSIRKESKDKEALEAEKPPKLKYFYELDKWVKYKWGGPTAYSPSYEEFLKHEVFLPEDDKIDEIIEHLLQNDYFKKKLYFKKGGLDQILPDYITTFLKYLDNPKQVLKDELKQKIKAEIEKLLENLWQNDYFKEILEQKPPGNITPLLKYSDSLNLQEKRDKFFENLLQSNNLNVIFYSQPPNHIADLITYLCENNLCESSQKILDICWNQQDIEVFKKYLLRWSFTIDSLY